MNHEGGDRMDAAWRWGDLTAELERQLGRGLQAGDLCVVMARAGVGKTTFLVQLGLGQALLGRDVVHITLNSSVAQVQAYYDSLYKTGATGMRGRLCATTGSAGGGCGPMPTGGCLQIVWKKL
jgi:hypothetical protein